MSPGKPSRGRRPPPTKRTSSPVRATKSARAGKRTTGKLGGGRGGGRSTGRTASPAAPRDKGLGGEQVEGRQAVRELLLAGKRRIREVWIANETEASPVLDDIVELAESRRVPIRPVGRSKFLAQARTDAPQGVLALASPLREVAIEELLEPVRGRAPFLLALDGVTDPHNLGALLRTAECAGVTGVILPRHRAAHVTATVTKAAAGAIEHLPMALVGGLPNAMLDLTKAGIWTVGLDANGTRGLFEGLPAATEGICVILGSEGKGLSRLVRQRCDEVVAIPLAGEVGHLNVSAAGALALYEVTRARAPL